MAWVIVFRWTSLMSDRSRNYPPVTRRRRSVTSTSKIQTRVVGHHVRAGAYEDGSEVAVSGEGKHRRKVRLSRYADEIVGKQG